MPTAPKKSVGICRAHRDQLLPVAGQVQTLEGLAVDHDNTRVSDVKAKMRSRQRAQSGKASVDER